MRFTTAKKTFTERELDYFSRLDYKSHNGIGIVVDTVGYPGVGTARYFLDKHDPTSAEWAVIVVDKFQGEGIGVMLFYSICIVNITCISIKD
jgi:acetyltransferase